MYLTDSRHKLHEASMALFHPCPRLLEDVVLYTRRRVDIYAKAEENGRRAKKGQTD